MASEGKHPHEFRRYRQALIAIYFAVVTAGGALLIASVLWQLVAPKPRMAPEGDPASPAISVEAPSPDELLRCHDDLSNLLKRLGDTAGELLSAPPADGRGEVGALWYERSRAWETDYERLGARCRFTELAAAQRGAALERMAEVYADLPAMLRTYQQLLEQFDDQLAGELARKRRALDRSREALSRRYRDAPAP